MTEIDWNKIGRDLLEAAAPAELKNTIIAHKLLIEQDGIRVSSRRRMKGSAAGGEEVRLSSKVGWSEMSASRSSNLLLEAMEAHELQIPDKK